jgi:hypothetical protein
MNCDRIDDRLLSMTSADREPAFDGEEREHIRACARCRERTSEAVAMFARLAAASGPQGSRPDAPGPAYWTSIVPRLRQRLEAGPRGAYRWWEPAIRTALMPAAAAVVLAVFLVISAVRAPVTGPTVALSSLSESELHDLGLAGSTTGLLEIAETTGASEWTVADFISDLVSEEGDTVLYAVADPEEILPHVDEEQFTEIVALLEHK